MVSNIPKGTDIQDNTTTDSTDQVVDTQNTEVMADGTPIEEVELTDIMETSSNNDDEEGVNFERKLYGEDYESDPEGARNYYYNFISESEAAGYDAFYLSFFSTPSTSYFGYTGTASGDVINRLDEDTALNNSPYIINGFEGDDNILGSGADNLMIGGMDNDILSGNGGDDVFYFEGQDNGVDVVDGGEGMDVILGSAGDDTIRLTSLTDGHSIEVLDGGDGFDVLAGTDDGDSFDLRNIEVRNIEQYDLGDGSDTFFGTADADTIYTGSGTKRIFGEDGDDTIILRTSHTIGESNEYNGGEGYDVIRTEDPSSDFILRIKDIDGSYSIEEIDLGSGYNIIEGTDRGNRLDFSSTQLNGVALIDGGAGSDTIIGTDGNDVIKGGEGSDTLVGGAGDDIFLVEGIDQYTSSRDDFNGGEGFDQIIGTDGDDLVRVRYLNADDSIEVLDLGDGYDVLEIRGSGNIDLSQMTVIGLDFINGGTSSDTIVATIGDDIIQGNEGNDKIDGSDGINTAVFRGNFVDYEITENEDGTYTVLDLNTADGNDGRDTLTNIHYAQFADHLEILEEPNLPPVAVDDVLSTDEETPLTFNPMANDTDADPISIIAMGEPENGTLIDNGDGTFTYEPFRDFNGSETITYTIQDSAGQTATATINITVNPVNDAPDARDNGITTTEDEAVVINVLNNDRDAEDDTLTITEFTQPINGTVALNADGTFTYTPNGNYFGTDTFTYTITDGNGGFDTASVNVNIEAANDAPDTVEDNITVDEDASATFDVLANDSDIDGDTLTLTSYSEPENGTLVQNADGTFTYTPNADFNGADSFTYTVTDGTASRTETVNITVVPENDAPVLTADDATTNEDESVIIDVLANDTDLDGDTLSVASVTNGANGTVSINADGTVTYTPNADYNGTDSFTYTVTDGTVERTETVNVTIQAQNDAPTTVLDSMILDEDTSASINVLNNDSDIDGDALTLESVTNGANGTVTIGEDGNVTYTPNENFNGTDSFTYTVTDGIESRTETVNVTVNPVNDAPTVEAMSVELDEDTSIVVDVLAQATDVDGDDLTISVFGTSPEHGSVEVIDGKVTYTPNANYFGADSFVYTVSDGNGGSYTGTVSVNVNPINDAPNATTDTVNLDEDTSATFNVLANDTDVDGDSISITSFNQPENGTLVQNADGTFTYTPSEGYNGPDSFSYTITDPSGETATASVNITVSPVNDAPTTVADSLEIEEDTSGTINVLANDNDADGDTLTITTFSQGANGSVTQNADGTFSYTPAENFNGVDTFTYTVTDGIESRTETVSVTVIPVNDAPVAVADAVELDEDTSATFDVLANDSDVDGDTLTVASFTQATNGAVTQNADGTFTYTPAENYNGADSFTYTVTDGAEERTETVSITVAPVNDAPVTAADMVELDEDTSATFDVLANDSDVDGDTLTVASFTQPENGQVVQNADGTFTYTPTENYNGADSFTYTVTDGAEERTETVSITVAPVNDAPVTVADAVELDEDTSATFDVLANDSDVDSDTLTVASFTQPANGQVVQNADGTFTYTPTANYNGADSFTYTVTDGAEERTETVSITVNEVNDTTLPEEPAVDPLPIPEHEVEVTFQFEEAGYKNTFGYYTVDASGNIHDVGFVFENASLKGSGGSLISGESTVSITVPEGQYIEFFNIANGYKLNGGYNDIDLDNGELVFLNANGDAYANVNDGEVPQLVFVDANGNTSTFEGHIYHTASSDMNPDGINHVKVEDTGVNDTRLSFEDLFNGGDKDFDDTVVDINIPRIVLRGDANANTIDMKNMSFNFYDQFVYVSHDGDDVLNGSAETDILRGHVGSDILNGNDGNDNLHGGTGADILNGGNGDDNLRMSVDSTWSSRYMAFNPYSGDYAFIAGMNRSDDIFNGGAGHDRLVATKGDDAIFLQGLADGPMVIDVEKFALGKGNDLLDMSSSIYSYGDIIVHAGDGHDIVWANDGDDRIQAGKGDDWVHGGAGNDNIFLSHGNDFAQGGEGDDIIRGHHGMDDLYGDAGNDKLYGGHGADILFGGEGNDLLYGQDDDDYLNGGTGDDFLHGGNGNDMLEGGIGDDKLHGGNGHDNLYGSLGDDFMRGNSGDDMLFGGVGMDKLYGDNGNDYLNGGSGYDYLHGGAGDDTLVASLGGDTLYGASGQDTFELNALSDIGNTILRFEANQDSIDLSNLLDSLDIEESEFMDNLSLEYTSRKDATLVYADDHGREINFFHFEHISRELDVDDLNIIT